MTYSDFLKGSHPSTITDIRSSTGLSRAAFCREYGIPLRTMEDWEAGRSTPPDYVVGLLAYAVMGGDQK